MNGEFAARNRRRLREEVLAAAEAALLARGWRGLRMVEIAETVGVSRQTLYNEFVNKSALARALSLRFASEYSDGAIALIEQAPDPLSCWRATTRYTLVRAAGDQRMKSILGADDRETFLPFFTSEGGPMIELLREKVAAATCRRWPELDPARVAVMTDITTRLMISHLVLPSEPVDTVVEQIAEVAHAYLSAGR